MVNHFTRLGSSTYISRIDKKGRVFIPIRLRAKLRLLEGTDILKEQLLSPFLTEIKNSDVFIVGKEEVLAFGKVGGLKARKVV